MKNNINTKDYWDNRFNKKSDNSWQCFSGEHQTKIFSSYIAKKLSLPTTFEGTILDFGCALGDALPIYRKYFPLAKLIGVDFSEKAIEVCKQKFNDTDFNFLNLDIDNIPQTDVIIASNILEHIDNDVEFIKKLLMKCNDLYIAVPFKEYPLSKEHIRAYDKYSFNDILKNNGVEGIERSIYLCRGLNYKECIMSFINIELKNTIRILLNRPISYGGVYRQILFHFKQDKY